MGGIPLKAHGSICAWKMAASLMHGLLKKCSGGNMSQDLCKEPYTKPCMEAYSQGRELQTSPISSENH